MDNRIKFAIVFVIINLHLLRNVSLIGYLAVYIPVAAYLAIRFILKVRGDSRKWSRFPLLAFATAVVIGTIMSLIFISATGTFVGLVRFIFAVPIFLALYLYTETKDELRHHLVTFVAFFAIAVVTLPLQLITGPVSWFAKPSERADLERYSSLVGSLTSVGIIVGCYLILAQVASRWLRIVLVAAISAASLFSLSKAAIVNIGIALIVLAIFYVRSVKFSRRLVLRIIASMAGVVILFGLGYIFVMPFSERIDVIMVSFGVGKEGVINYDSTVVQSAIDRLSLFPMKNIQALAVLGSPIAFIFGGGFGLASTALVPKGDSLGPMAHNQFVELFTVFGAVGAALLIATMAVILIGLIQFSRRDGTKLATVILMTYCLWLLNAIFANGVLYQPAGASIFYLAMFGGMFGRLLESPAVGGTRSLEKNGPAGSLVAQLGLHARTRLRLHGRSNSLS